MEDDIKDVMDDILDYENWNILDEDEHHEIKNKCEKSNISSVLLQNTLDGKKECTAIEREIDSKNSSALSPIETAPENFDIIKSRSEILNKKPNKLTVGNNALQQMSNDKLVSLNSEDKSVNSDGQNKNKSCCESSLKKEFIKNRSEDNDSQSCKSADGDKASEKSRECCKNFSTIKENEKNITDKNGKGSCQKSVGKKMEDYRYSRKNSRDDFKDEKMKRQDTNDKKIGYEIQKDFSRSHIRKSTEGNDRKKDKISSSHKSSSRKSPRRVSRDECGSKHDRNECKTTGPRLLTKALVESLPSRCKAANTDAPTSKKVKQCLLLGDERYSCLAPLVSKGIKKKFYVITRPGLTIQRAENLLAEHLDSTSEMQASQTLFIYAVGLSDMIKVDTAEHGGKTHKIFSLMHPPSAFVKKIVSALHKLAHTQQTDGSKTQDVKPKLMVAGVWPVSLYEYYSLINDCGSPPEEYASQLMSLDSQLTLLINNLNAALQRSKLMSHDVHSTCLFSNLTTQFITMLDGIYPPSDVVDNIAKAVNNIIECFVDKSPEYINISDLFIAGDTRIASLHSHWPANHVIFPTVLAGDITVDTLPAILNKHFCPKDCIIVSMDVKEHLTLKKCPDCEGHEPLEYWSFVGEKAQNPFQYASKLLKVLKLALDPRYHHHSIIPASIISLNLLNERRTLAEEHYKKHGHSVEFCEAEVILESQFFAKYVDELNKAIQDECILNCMMFLTKEPPHFLTTESFVMENNKKICCYFCEAIDELLNEIPLTMNAIMDGPARYKPQHYKWELNKKQTIEVIRSRGSGPNTSTNFIYLAKNLDIEIQNENMKFKPQQSFIQDSRTPSISSRLHVPTPHGSSEYHRQFYDRSYIQNDSRIRTDASPRPWMTESVPPKLQSRIHDPRNMHADRESYLELKPSHSYSQLENRPRGSLIDGPVFPNQSGISPHMMQHHQDIPGPSNEHRKGFSNDQHSSSADHAYFGPSFLHRPSFSPPPHHWDLGRKSLQRRLCSRSPGRSRPFLKKGGIRDRSRSRGRQPSSRSVSRGRVPFSRRSKSRRRSPAHTRSRSPHKSWSHKRSVSGRRSRSHCRLPRSYSHERFHSRGRSHSHVRSHSRGRSNSHVRSHSRGRSHSHRRSLSHERSRPSGRLRSRGRSGSQERRSRSQSRHFRFSSNTVKTHSRSRRSHSPSLHSDPLIKQALASIAILHNDECRSYMNRPTNHPSYAKELNFYMGSPETLSMISLGIPQEVIVQQFNTIWFDKMQEIFELAWQKKKKNMLKMMNFKKGRRYSGRNSRSHSRSPRRPKKRKKSSSSEESLHRPDRRSTTPASKCPKAETATKIIPSPRSSSLARSQSPKLPAILPRVEEGVPAQQEQLSPMPSGTGSSLLEQMLDKDRILSLLKNTDTFVPVNPKFKFDSIMPNINTPQSIAPSISTTTVPNVSDKECEEEVEVNVVSVLTVVNEMAHKAGPLGSAIPLLLQKAQNAETNGIDPAKSMDVEDVTLFEMIHLKFSSIAASDSTSFVEKIIVEEAATQLSNLIKFLKKPRKPNTKSHIKEWADITVHMNTGDTLLFLKKKIVETGCSESIECLYMALKEEHKKLINSDIEDKISFYLPPVTDAPTSVKGSNKTTKSVSRSSFVLAPRKQVHPLFAMSDDEVSDEAEKVFADNVPLSVDTSHVEGFENTNRNAVLPQATFDTEARSLGHYLDQSRSNNAAYHHKPKETSFSKFIPPSQISSMLITNYSSPSVDAKLLSDLTKYSSSLSRTSQRGAELDKKSNTINSDSKLALQLLQKHYDIEASSSSDTASCRKPLQIQSKPIEKLRFKIRNPESMPTWSAPQRLYDDEDV